MGALDDVSDEELRCWTRMIADRLQRHADALSVRPLSAAEDAAVPVLWGRALRCAYELAYIWDVTGTDEGAGLFEHLEDTDRPQLQAIVDAMSDSCLDLGQHLAFTLGVLRPELRPAAGRRTVELLRQVADIPVADLRERTPGMAIFGADGLAGFSS